MTTRITVNTRPGNRVVVDSPQRDQAVTVKMVGTSALGAGGADKLVQLVDVDATSVDNNETVVWDEIEGKFVIKELPVVNGGTF